MARITEERDVTPVLDAAASWIDKCLIQDGSQLSSETLWTKSNAEELRAAFVDQPDDSKGKSFLEKLNGQLAHVTPQAKRLAAEMLWALRLFPTNILRKTKRASVLTQWATSGTSLSEDHPMLSDGVLQGVGSAGQGFNQYLWKEFAFLIGLTTAVKTMQAEQRRSVLTDYDSFMAWIDKVPQEGYRQFRHMLRYFAFPDLVEGIVSGQHLRRILHAFEIAPESRTSNWTDRQFDEAMFQLRRQLEKEFPGRPLSFYQPPLKERWSHDDGEEDDTGTSMPALLVWVGKNATKNYQVGMTTGIWGFPNAQQDYSKVRAGTYIIFGRENSGGSPRVSKDAWAQETIAEVNVCRATSAFRQDHTPHWPDETSAKVLYPHRVDIEHLHTFKHVSTKSNIISEDAFEALRLSALGAGKGVYVDRALLGGALTLTDGEHPHIEIDDDVGKDDEEVPFEAVDLRRLIPALKKSVDEALLVATSEQLRRLAAALMAKRFLILTGLAGSGKTKLAEAFARWITLDQAANVELVPVGADWTGNENILGYPDGLDKGQYVTRPALRVLLSARRNPRLPHFLILDEMNLSHVERYFADILSLIESGGALELYAGDLRRRDTWRKDGAGEPVPPRLAALPANLYIIGTVNVDETTYMFSPKVLDRASVIEFRMSSDEIDGFLQNPAKPSLTALDGAGASFGPTFVHAAAQPVELVDDMRKFYEAEMSLFFRVLQPHGAEFGYRTAHEAGRFLYFYQLLSTPSEVEPEPFSAAFDCVIVQKLLPKLHGSRAKLGPLLKKLWFLCSRGLATRTDKPQAAAEEASRSTDKKMDPTIELPADAPYPMSAEKIARMWRLLNENGFTSFAEA